MVPPAGAEAVAWVLIVGLALVTVQVSPGSLQAVVAELLLASPLRGVFAGRSGRPASQGDLPDEV
jgi:hypothetical protein